MPVGLRLFNTHDLTILRKADGFFENNEFSDNTSPPVEIDIKCNIQPYKEKQSRIALPEGMRSEYCIVIYSRDIDFQTTVQNTQSLADTFEYDGFTWECYLAQKWRGHGMRIQHSVCLAVRIDRESDPEELDGWQI